MDTPSTFEIAIIGGGISGLTLAIGLIERGINVKLYEQAHGFAEIGAGVAFGPNAVRSMHQISPKVSEAYMKVYTTSQSPAWKDVWFRWVDGYHSRKQNASGPDAGHAHKDYVHDDEAFDFDIKNSEVRGNGGCHRAHYLDELMKLVPDQCTAFQKHLDTVEDRGESKRILLKFHDGTTAEADAVIGCDGIKSSLRVAIHGKDNPASYPHYSHWYAIRGLVPMERAAAVLGPMKASNMHMHQGPGAHLLTFPVNHGKVMNVVGFIRDANEWPDVKHLTLPSKKGELIGAFKGWSKSVEAICDLLTDDLDKWGIFDTFDHPLDYFNKGRLVLLGDAAHATTPHHGAGAGMCIEDAAVMCGLLEAAKAKVDQGSTSSAKVLAQVFQVFNDVRKERGQFLVKASRFAGHVYEWDAETQSRAGGRAAAVSQLEANCRTLWSVDEKQLINEAVAELESRLS